MFIERSIPGMKLLFFVFLNLISLSGQAREPELEHLLITNTEGKTLTFNIEIARSDTQMRRGLMFRDQMPEDRGMLFIYKPERVATMWMKNTILSLDMLFIDEHGVIVTIAENTTPFSLETISSGQPVRAVLELNAGQVKQHNLKAGDTVSHALFDQN